jgi:hypothetical protein
MATKGTTTPKGTFQYPKFFTPDTKFDEAGVYSGTLVLDLTDEKVKGLLKQLEDALKDAIETAKKDATKKGKKPPKVCQDKPWTVDEEAGTLTLRAKKKATFKDKKTDEIVNTKLAVFGPDNTPMKDPGYLLGSGSVGRMTVQISPFGVDKASPIGVGISLRLLAVQILEAREYERDGASFGFDAVEQAEEAAADDKSGEGAPAKDGEDESEF